jgi:hypothetical protein
MLFMGSLLAFTAFAFLAMGLPRAALGIGVCFLITFSLMMARCIRAWLECRSARAPVGPLSVDERLKARSKLLKPRQNIVRPESTSAFSAPFY